MLEDDDYESFDVPSASPLKRDGSTSYEFMAPGFVPVLLCVRGFGRGTIYVLDRNRVRIGRPFEDSIPDIPLFHPREEENFRFSRLHATIDVASGAIGVTSHYRETGGVIVSGRPLGCDERTLIGFGDVIELLGTAFVLESEACALESEVESFAVPLAPPHVAPPTIFGRSQQGTLLASPDSAGDFSIPTILPSNSRFQGIPDGGTYFADNVDSPRAAPRKPAVLRAGKRTKKPRDGSLWISPTTLSLLIVVALASGGLAWMNMASEEVAAAAEPELRVGARRDLECSMSAILMQYDTDGDGVPEIVLGDDTGRVRVLSASLLDRWSVSLASGAIDSSLRCLKSGPNEEVEIWVATATAELFRLDAVTGTIKAQRMLASPAICPPIMLETDAQRLIVVAGIDGGVVALDDTLTEVWSHDGEDAVVTAPHPVRGGLLVFDCEPSIRYLSERGALIKKISLRSAICGPPAVLDVAGSLWPDLLAIDEAGALHRIQVSASSVADELVFQSRSVGKGPPRDSDLRRTPSPALAYLDDDDALDCLFVSPSGSYAALRGPDFKEEIWRLDSREQVVAGPAIADLTGDGICDLVSIAQGKITVLDGRDGFERASLDLSTPGSSPGLFGSIVGADFLGQETLSCAVANRFGLLFRIDTERTLKHGEVLWAGRADPTRRVDRKPPGLLANPLGIAIWGACFLATLAAGIVALKMIQRRSVRSKRI